MQLPEREVLFQHPLISVEALRYAPHETRLVVRRGAFAAVCLVFYTPSGESGFLTLTQYRFAAGETLHEHPAGMIDPGESPLEAALRELYEETGWLFTVEDLVPLTPAGLYPSPALWGEVGYFYAVRLQVPPAVVEAYRTGTTRVWGDEKIALSFRSGADLLRQTRNLQTLAHTYLYYARFGAPNGELPSPAT